MHSLLCRPWTKYDGSDDLDPSPIQDRVSRLSMPTFSGWRSSGVDRMEPTMAS
jgi:hypothetical protein